MPRPMRAQARPSTRVRPRHKSWMRAMAFATVGWGVIWASLAASKLGWTPPLKGIYALSGIPGLVGVWFALLTVRARPAWLLMAGLALFANGTLVAMPFLFDEELREALLR